MVVWNRLSFFLRAVITSLTASAKCQCYKNNSSELYLVYVEQEQSENPNSRREGTSFSRTDVTYLSHHRRVSPVVGFVLTGRSVHTTFTMHSPHHRSQQPTRNKCYLIKRMDTGDRKMSQNADGRKDHRGNIAL